MGDRSTTIHVNPAMPHQVEYGAALVAGFKRHGVTANVTHSPKAGGDIHICIGPHFAKYDRCILLDRAYWGDPLYVSVHLVKNGKRVYTQNPEPRAHPPLMPMKQGNRTIYLCDYGEKPPTHYDTIRRHPAEQRPVESLEAALLRHDRAVGQRSTALVTAAFMGLAVETTNTQSPAYGITDRERWANNLAWHNWSKVEIENGDMLDALGNCNAPG